MAEERLIDDDIDKSRKYRVLVGDDGEKELYIDEPARKDEIVFEVPEEQPEEEGDDLAARRERERERLSAEGERQIAAAEEDIANARYSTALEHIARAEKCGESRANLGMLYMRAYTKNFTDFAVITSAAEHAEDIKDAPREQKDEILSRSGEPLAEGIDRLRTDVTDLDARNESAKAERAAVLKVVRNKWLAIFFATLLPLIACIALSAWFSSVMYTVSTGLYLILTVVFAVLALLLLVAWAFAFRKLLTALRRLRANSRNTSTKLGRELLSKQAQLRAYIAVYNALRN